MNIFIIIIHKILKMDSKSDRSVSQGQQNNHRRKSTRKKKAVESSQPERVNRRTRKKGITSDQQYALPQIIPISDNTDLITFQSFDRQTTKIIIRIPLLLYKQQHSEKQTLTRVQESMITLKICIDQDMIIINAKMAAKQAKENGNKNVHDHDEQQEGENICVWGKTFWVGNYQVGSKLTKQSHKNITSAFSQIQKIKTKDVNSDIFVIMNLRKKVVITTDYNGLINQGNTCYMNSYLQMLYHISQFQNLVFEAHVQDQKKFPATLQILFYNLARQQKAVSPEQLVKSFGWSKKQAAIQQDAQEFSCLFFEVLQKKLDEFCFDTKRYNMREIFSGKLLHAIQCTDVGTYFSYSDFRSQHEQIFFDLQLGLSESLEKSLDDYVCEQLLCEDNMYETQIYGKQTAKKSVRLLNLPPILMIQLKRFQFSPYTYKNQKIMHKFTYPNEIDFARWLVHSDSKSQYQLYAVLVHQGVKAESGHYYVYIKVEDSWYRFNDQEVTKCSDKQVFDYNFGGEIEVVDLDSRQLKVVNRSVTLSSTAYMLVYTRKDMVGKLLQNQIAYPNWLKQRQISKQEEKEELKARKNYYNKIKTVNWDDGLVNKNANYIGLFEKGMDEEDLSSCIDRIPKTQKIQQWVKPYNEVETGVYLYLTNLEKTEYQSIINFQHRKSTFQELIRDNSNLIILFLPLIVPLNSYLFVIKLLTVKQTKEIEVEGSNSPQSQPPLDYELLFNDLLEINKSSKNFELLNALTEKYHEQGYHYRFYYEQKKQLKLINKDNSLVCGPVTARNILSIIIVEKIPIQILEEYPKLLVAQNWFTQKINTVEILVKSENGKYQFCVYVDKNMLVDDLRDLIYQQKLRDDEMYASSANIVLKSKPKKNSKVFIEISAVKVKDLIKGCDRDKIIVFEPSNLNAEERISQIELKFFYQFQDFSFSDCYHIIVDKKTQQESFDLYKKILAHEEIQNFLQIEKKQEIRLLLFSKDRLSINQLVLPNGYISGKGQLFTVLQKQKNTNLVVMGFNSGISEDKCPIFINHKTQNGDKIGCPRYLQVNKNTTLLTLRQQILEKIKDQTYEWQDKTYPLNPFKLYIYAYWKDIRKSIELIEQNQIEQLQDNNGNCEANSNVSGQASNQKSDKINNNGQNKMDIQNKQEQNGDKKEATDYRKFTILSKFVKAKSLKVCINHLYLVKANQMKLNV